LATDYLKASERRDPAIKPSSHQTIIAAHTEFYSKVNNFY
jgi:hypothetical protein